MHDGWLCCCPAQLAETRRLLAAYAARAPPPPPEQRAGTVSSAGLTPRAGAGEDRSAAGGHQQAPAAESDGRPSGTAASNSGSDGGGGTTDHLPVAVGSLCAACAECDVTAASDSGRLCMLVGKGCVWKGQGGGANLTRWHRRSYIVCSSGRLSPSPPSPYSLNRPPFVTIAHTLSSLSLVAHTPFLSLVPQADAAQNVAVLTARVASLQSVCLTLRVGEESGPRRTRPKQAAARQKKEPPFDDWAPPHLPRISSHSLSGVQERDALERRLAAEQCSRALTETSLARVTRRCDTLQHRLGVLREAHTQSVAGQAQGGPCVLNLCTPRGRPERSSISSPPLPFRLQSRVAALAGVPAPASPADDIPTPGPTAGWPSALPSHRPHAAAAAAAAAPRYEDGSESDRSSGGGKAAGGAEASGAGGGGSGGRGGHAAGRALAVLGGGAAEAPAVLGRGEDQRPKRTGASAERAALVKVLREEIARSGGISLGKGGSWGCRAGASGFGRNCTVLPDSCFAPLVWAHLQPASGSDYASGRCPSGRRPAR